MSSLNDLQDMIKTKYGLEAAALGPDTSMRESGVDSLALVEFLFDVEDKYGISVPETHAGIDTLAQLAVVVDELVAAKAAKAQAGSTPAAPAAATAATAGAEPPAA